MDVEFWTKWVTLGGVLVAAISGVWSLALQIRGKRDTFKVGMGTIMPEILPDVVMHVVSQSDHPIRIADYGFIEAGGRLTSIPMTAESDPYVGHEALFRGCLNLAKRGDSMEAGYCRRKAVIGCFAITNLQVRPKFAFAHDTSHAARLWVTCKIRLKGSAYLL